MSDQLTTSEIVSIERELIAVDPKLLGESAMITLMACKLDATDEAEGTLRTWLAHYVAFRWPKLRTSLERSLAKGELVGTLLQDVLRRKAHLN